MTSKKLDPGVSDLLTRARRTGLSDVDIQERARLAPGWMAQAKRGRYGPEAESVRKLARFLDRFEAGKTAPTATPTVIETAPSSSQPGPAADPAKTSRSLADEIEAARTAKALGRITTRIAASAARGELKDLRLVDVLERLIARKAKLLKDERDEKAIAQVRSLEILTTNEVELLRVHREKLAGPPMKPGDSAPPPTEEPPPSEAAPAA